MMNHAEDDVFTPPLQSRATRQMPKRSRASCRGVITLNNQRYVFESLVELRTLFQGMMRDDVIDIWDQPPAVPYRNRRGQIKTHTFDFLFTMRCGRKLAIAVKSHARAVTGKFREELELIGSQMPDGFADEIVLVTEKDLSKTSTTSAARCLQSQRILDPQADDAVASAIVSNEFPITVEKLVLSTGLWGRGYRALLRAIATGQLAVTNNGSVDYGSIVVRGAY